MCRDSSTRSRGIFFLDERCLDSQQDGVTRPNSGDFSAITPMSGGRSPPPADSYQPHSGCGFPLCVSVTTNFALLVMTDSGFNAAEE